MADLIKLSKLPNGYAKHPDNSNFKEKFERILSQVYTLEIMSRADGYSVKAHIKLDSRIPNPIYVIDDWIRDLIMDPETKTPRLNDGITLPPSEFTASLKVMRHEYPICYPLVTSPNSGYFTIAIR